MQKNHGLLLMSSLFVTTQVFATMTPTFERGQKNIYHMSPRGVQEVCVIPAKYPEAKYKNKDLKKEIQLCNIHFYETNPEEQFAGFETAALCPKLNSTNPAINIFEVNTKEKQMNVGGLEPQQTKNDLESKNCEDADKIGKYKNSTSCSYTPAIVGYYHLSRILGGIGRVPVSVLRSMDIETHKEIARKGVRLTPEGLLIHETWEGLLGILNNGLASKRKDLVLSDDGQQSYGAFVVNPKKEEFYKSLFTNGPDRAVAFRDKNEIFQFLRNPAPLNNIVKSDWTAKNLQTLIAMKDITEFILLDHIMDQQDRFGNIAYQVAHVFMAKDKAEDQKFDFNIESDTDEYIKQKEAGLVDLSKPELAINSMILKDNDCGVSKTNVVKQAQLLKELRHMEPKTYKKLLEFQKSVLSNKKFFTSNLMFTALDFDEMVANVNDAVQILKTNCESGLLKLDLDVDYYLENNKVKNGSCQLEEKQNT
jgi:hypothetical protein